MPLSPKISKYFWDINLLKARPKSFPEFYIKRVLEFGNKEAFNWLKKVFGSKRLKIVAKKLHLSPKTKNFLPYV